MLAEHYATGAVTVLHFSEGYVRFAGANAGSYCYTRDHLVWVTYTRQAMVVIQ